MRNPILSSLLVTTFALVFMLAQSVSAHEIRPAIADLTVTQAQVEMEIRLTLESLVAGMDLSELQDTNASPLARQYDRLRSLNPAELESALHAVWPELAQGFQVFAGDQRLGLEITTVVIPDVGDIELSRESTLTLRAPLPADNSPITAGWAASFGPLVIRQVLDSGDGYSGYLTNGEPSAAIPRSGSARQPWLTVFVDYIGIGYIHIVPKGLDHILFVLGLFFFSLKMRPLLFQITAFTVAHTVSLALAVLGYVQIPPNVVEPLIAASIVYVAVENTLTNSLRPWRTAVVFGFGLLHGLGFASVLGEIGLDPGRFITGLIGFNIGVELGQLSVITAAFLLVGFWFGKKPWYRPIIARPASVAIAFVGAFWFVQRVFF